MMEKMKMHSPNLTQENIARIRELFPDCVTEAQGGGGQLGLVVDFDQLRQELSESIVEGPQERYHLNWPGKREALLTANAPIARTLRPCREESVDFDTTKNLFIEGDNLEVLKLLQETYLGKVKMIYIDPPYNTGNDFIYEDDFAENTEAFLKRSNQKDEEGNRLVANTEANGRFHSDWLSMIYPRLKLARNLLGGEGVIFISIDDGEVGNVRKLCDEIFGGENFVTSVIWEKRRTRENRRVFSFNHDYILCYAKNKAEFELVRNLLPLTDEARARYSNPDNDPRGDWQSVALTAQAGHGTKSQFYTITTPSGRQIDPPSGNCWRVTFPKLQELIADNRIWFGSSGNNVPRRKLFLCEQNEGLTPHTLWTADEVGTTDSAKRDLNLLFGGATVFDTPKPIELMTRIIHVSTKPDDLVLDFFAGTSPVAHAAMQLNAEDGGNRKFIMVQLPEPCAESSEALKAGYKTIAEISKERIRRAGKKILEGQCHEDWNKDIGFRVLKIDSSNMADVYYTPDAIEQGQLKIFTDNIKPDRKPEDLLFQVLLDWGVDLSLPIRKETIQGKTVFFVNEPPYDLVACFDTGVNEDLVKELAKFEPLRVVFRDTGFVSDAVKINVEQIFKQLSPGTEVKSI
jgi:adenine-specific DNA-methyltransferase